MGQSSGGPKGRGWVGWRGGPPPVGGRGGGGGGGGGAAGQRRGPGTWGAGRQIRRSRSSSWASAVLMVWNMTVTVRMAPSRHIGRVTYLCRLERTSRRRERRSP